MSTPPPQAEPTISSRSEAASSPSKARFDLSTSSAQLQSLILTELQFDIRASTSHNEDEPERGKRKLLSTAGARH